MISSITNLLAFILFSHESSITLKDVVLEPQEILAFYASDSQVNNLLLLLLKLSTIFHLFCTFLSCMIAQLNCSFSEIVGSVKLFV